MGSPRTTPEERARLRERLGSKWESFSISLRNKLIGDLLDDLAEAEASRDRAERDRETLIEVCYQERKHRFDDAKEWNTAIAAERQKREAAEAERDRLRDELNTLLVMRTLTLRS